MSKQLWVLTGGNGAGKSTFYRTRLAPLGMPFINADMIAKELFPDSPEAHSYLAAQIAEEKRNELLLAGHTFCFETVFSHPSKVDFVARAKALGYQVILVLIHLDNVGLNKARISQRIEEGGHSVPDQKVEERIPRVLKWVKAAAPLCDQLRALDNTSASKPFKAVFTVRNGDLKGADVHIDPLPEWVEEFLS